MGHAAKHPGIGPLRHLAGMEENVAADVKVSHLAPFKHETGVMRKRRQYQYAWGVETIPGDVSGDNGRRPWDWPSGATPWEPNTR